MPNIKIKKFSRSKVMDTIPEQQTIENEVNDVEQLNEKFVEVQNDDGYDGDKDNDLDDLFEDLDNEHYVSEETDVKKSKAEKEKIKLEKEQLKLDIARQKEEERRRKAEDRENAKLSKQTKEPKTVDSDLFSSTPTELLGLDKRQLLKKICEYKALFPTQLKSFKIKKNPTLEDLQNVLSEMDAIVSVDSVEGFATDAILSTIGLVEGISSKTRYNISGTAQMLKEQPKFHSLCKQLYLKHKVFSNVPPEMQMIMLVGFTASLAKQQNDRRDGLNKLLSKPVENII